MRQTQFRYAIVKVLPFVLCAAVAGGRALASDLPLTDKIEDLTRNAKPLGSKVILLNVWGQTCSRCILEMPIIVRAVNAMKDNVDVGFIGLCIPDDDPAKNKKVVTICSKIAEKKQVNYPTFIWSGDGDPLTAKFNITATPYNCLMSADGKILTELDIPEGNQEKAYAYVIDAIGKALKDRAPAKPAPLSTPPKRETKQEESAEIVAPPEDKAK